MQTYKTMTKVYLQRNNPQELERLKAEGKLKGFLQDVEEQYSEMESDLIAEATQRLPSGTMERAKKLNQAKMTAREVTTAQLTEFLSSL